MKTNFQSEKKMNKSVREKKVTMKKIKNLKNCRRETQKVSVNKIAKMTKNVFHGNFSFSR